MFHFFILFISLILFILILPFGILFKIIKLKINKDYILRICYSIDQLGNVINDELFNFLFIRKSNFIFGNENQTISLVLAINKKRNKLTKIGKILLYILNKIDFEHDKKSIIDHRNRLKKSEI